MTKRLGSMKTLFVMAGFLLVVGATSCGVRQKVIVTSEPTGAMVTMNGVNLGTTPVEQPFTWFWYYDFVAEKDGYENAGVRKRFRAPIWLWPPLDLVMEAMPFYVPSVKRVHIKMKQVDDRPAPAFSVAEPKSAS